MGNNDSAPRASPLVHSSSTGLTSRSGSEAKIFHHEITSSPASARTHGRTPRSHSGTRPHRLPVESVKSRSKTAPSRLNREVATRNGSAELFHAGRRGRNDKYGRKKRAFFLGKRPRSFGVDSARDSAPFRENPFRRPLKRIAGRRKKAGEIICDIVKPLDLYRFIAHDVIFVVSSFPRDERSMR